MPSSPIRRLVDFALQAQRRGVRVHYLNIGQPDILSPKEFWQAIRESDLPVLEYSHSAGVAGLREAAAEDYTRRGIPVSTSEVMITTGGSEACLFAFLTCFDPGDEVIVIEPFYANYLGFAVEAGVHLRAVTTKIEDGFQLPSVEDLAAQLSPRTKGILLCNPSNPTGTVYPPAQLRAIGELCKKHDLYLLGDEVYRDFYYGQEELLSVLQIEGLDQHAIMLDSASKRFSLCGARVGFLVSRNADVMAGAIKYGQARLASPTLDQIGVQASIQRTPESYFADVRQEYIARRDLLVRELSAIPGVVVPPIEGAFYAMVRLPVDDSDRFCQWLLTDFAHDNETVLMAPASGFYATPGLGTQEVRIAYVLERDRLHAATRVLRAALEAYPGRTL